MAPIYPKGVVFLFNEHPNLKIISHEMYEEVRTLSLKMEINGLKLQIFNIPTYRERFIKKITETIDETCVHIIAGDFNCVMDGRFDRNPPSCNKIKVTLEWMN